MNTLTGCQNSFVCSNCDYVLVMCSQRFGWSSHLKNPRNTGGLRSQITQVAGFWPSSFSLHLN
jgi:hypothetical protein